ncbi:MAG: 23S rRNA (adenine(2503)-C(2))-methyltransferase RlmN [Phycisphaerae bacterium]
MQSDTAETGRTASLLAQDLDTLRRRVEALDESAFRAGQILRWTYQRGASSFAQMTDLPAGLRERLNGEFHIYEGRTVADRCSADGTRKLLLQWADGASTECVLIPDGNRRTACISTQVGCPVGCVFCASGLNGLERQLHTGQIVEQAMRLGDTCGPQRLTNVVFMGLGEPLHNYDATLAAVRVLNAEWGLNVGARKITISTVGLPKQIKRLGDEKLQVTLAISLHAPNDALRSEIIPWAESISIDDLVEAANYYFARTGRETTLEYILLGGLNDQPHHARQLAAVAKRMRSNVNLIRYNPVAGLPYQRPTSQAAARFQNVLRERAVNCHMRRSRGLDIEGACGQLRRRYVESLG